MRSKKSGWVSEVIRQLKVAEVVSCSDVEVGDVLLLDFNAMIDLLPLDLPIGTNRVAMLPREKSQEMKRLEKWLVSNRFHHFSFSHGKDSILFVSRDANRISDISNFLIDSIPVEDSPRTGELCAASL